MNEQILDELGADAGYLKGGFLGFQKSGKTFTATLLAGGVRKVFNLDAPIAFFDTEGGSPYISQMIEKATGRKPVGKRSRSFDDMLAVGRACEAGGASVLIVDSVTHVWRELCAAYMRQINEQRQRKGMSPLVRLEFQHWSRIKDHWAQWTDFYLNSRLHIIVCGRAGYEYDFEEREDGSGKDLVKTGIKMKVEGEFGYEPSLLVNMERAQVLDGTAMRIVHRATVIGDRFNLIDGASCENPTFEFFAPHVLALQPGSHAAVDTEVKTDMGLDEEGADAYVRERRQRVILCEEIQGELVRLWPGQTAKEKASKLEYLEDAFGTRSWTKVESMNAERLRDGLARLREATANIKPAPVATEEVA
jgi:hypothetical protein